MINLNIIVEGQTEETFVRDVLAPYRGTRGIFAVARCVETGRKRGRIFRGGVRNYEKIRRDIKCWLNQRQDTYCTTMFDFYGLPKNFPGRTSIDSNQQARERVKYIEKAFEKDIDTIRFIPYIQLHEFEALLFAGIERLNVFYLEDKLKEIK